MRPSVRPSNFPGQRLSPLTAPVRRCRRISILAVALLSMAAWPAAASAAEETLLSATAASQDSPPSPDAPGPAVLIVRGTVKDASGQPLSEVEVSMTEIARRTFTAADGSFAFEAMPARNYTMAVRRLGYSPVALEIGPKTRFPLALSLYATPFEMEPVNVTAMRSPVFALRSPYSMASLSGTRLRSAGTVSLAHTIEQLPGVRTLSTGTEIGKPVLRGMAGSRTLVLDNGSRLEDYSWSDEDGPSVDPGDAQRIEVIRGPASVLYGSDALAGAVNVIPAGILEGAGARGYRGTLDLYAASNNREGGAAVGIEGARGRLGWRGHGVIRKSEALHTPEGELENTGFWALDGEAAVAYRDARQDVALRYARYGGEFHLLEANGPPPGTEEGEEEGPVRKADDNRLQLTGHRSLGAFQLETRAQYERHSLIEVSDEATAGAGKLAKEEPAAFDLLLNTASIDLLLRHPSVRGVHGIFGVSGMHQNNDTRGPIPLVPDAQVGSGAVFLLEQVDLSRLTLVAGGRWDSRRLRSDANADLGLASEKRDYSIGSGELGIVYQPHPTVALAGNVGRAWRAPNLFELLSNGPHVGEARWERGDITLREERALSLDASVRVQARRVRAEIAGFRNLVDDFIFIEPTGSFVDTLRVYEYDQADAVLTGGEAWGEVALMEAVTAGVRYDFVRGERRQDSATASKGDPLPQIPPPRLVLGLRWEEQRFSWADRIFVAPEVEIVSKQTRRTEFDRATDGYTLVHIDAGLDRRLAGRDFRFGLSLRNAANTKYRNYLSRYKEFALDPGRNVILRVSTGF